MPLPQDHEAVGVGVRQWTHEDAVDDAEDGARGADAERKRQRRGDREPGVVPKNACRVPQIEDEVLERTAAARVARVFLERLESAELPRRPAPRFVRRAALPDVFRRLALEVIAHLGVHRLLDRVAAEKQSKAPHPARQ